MLHEIKHDGVKVKEMFIDIYKVCAEAIKLGCTNFRDQDIYYSFQCGEEKPVICTAEDDIDFLFNL